VIQRDVTNYPGNGRVRWETNGFILRAAGRPKWKFQLIWFINGMGVYNDSTAIGVLNQGICGNLLMMPRVRVVVDAGSTAG
jgi:hypothetical protein